MTFKFWIYIIFSILLVVSCNQKPQEEQRIQPPVAHQDEESFIIHGVSITDEFSWMNEGSNLEMEAYLNAENNYADSVLKKISPQKEELLKQIKKYSEESIRDPPLFSNEHFFYIKEEEKGGRAVFTSKPGKTEKLVFSVSKIVGNESLFDLADYAVSPDGQYLALTIDSAQTNSCSLMIKDLASGRILDDSIPGISSNIVWANDNQTIFYTANGENGLPSRLFQHKVGSSYFDDMLVFEETDPEFYIEISKSSDNSYIILNSKGSNSSECYYISANDPNIEPVLFAPRLKGLEYEIFPHLNSFFVLTHTALGDKLLHTSGNTTAMENWTTIINFKGRNSPVDMLVVKDYLVLHFREKMCEKLLIAAPTGKIVDSVALESQPSFIKVQNVDFEDNVFLYSVSSFIEPIKTVMVDMQNRKKDMVWINYSLEQYDPEKYYSSIFLIDSHDNKKIPLAIVYKKGLEKKGNNPTYIHIYGSENQSAKPEYSPARVYLLDQGFVFAFAYVRGSGGIDKEWISEGKLLFKKNAIKDLISSAEFLIKENYTSSEKLFASGSYEGGLLVLAAVNAKPDLFQAVVAHSPITDLISQNQFGSTDLQAEYGNLQNEDHFKYMLSFSPYHNIQNKQYPDMLITGSEASDGSVFADPIKYVARIRLREESANIVLLKTLRYSSSEFVPGFDNHDFKRIALEYAFILEQIKTKEKGQKGL